MRRVFEVLKELNPWWSDPKWYNEDRDIQQVFQSRVESRVRYRFRDKWVKSLISSSDSWGVRVLRGPRRVGKTTLMKLLIKDAIDNGLNPRAIVYLTLDNVELMEAIEKGVVSLRGLLRELISSRLKQYGKVMIVIDEATFYDKWAITIKNLIDEHVIGPGVLVLITGSYSLELSQAKRELEGRMGILDNDDVGQRFLFPMRFVELIENIAQEVNEFLKEPTMYGGPPTKLSTRLTIFEELITPNNARVFKFFEKAYDEIGKLAIGYLEGVYFYTGGFPEAIYSFIRIGKVPDKSYTSFYELLIQDAEKFGLSPRILEELLREKLVVSASFEMTFSELQIPIRLIRGGVKVLSIYEAERYLDYLTEGARVLLKLHTIKPIRKLNEPITFNRGKPLKLVYLDPLIFHSLYWISRGVRTGIYQTAKSFTLESMTSSSEDRIFFSSLYEAVVCSHIIRIPIMKYGVYVETYGRGVDGKEYADCIAWYFDQRALRHKIVPVEITTSRRLDEEALLEKARLAMNYLRSRLIVATRDQLAILTDRKGNVEAIAIPASLLLLLI